MKRLINLRENYWRIIRDRRIIRANPQTLSTRLAKIAITRLRNATKNLHGEEKFKQMEEIGMKVFEGFSEAIEELEKDLELNPRKFLGLPLYPGDLWSGFFFFVTLALGLV